MAPVSEEDAAALRDRHYNAVLTRIEVFNPSLWIVRVRPAAGVLPYLPGQYTTLGLGIWEPRMDGYTMERIRPGQEKTLVLRAYSFSHPVIDAATGGLQDPDRLDTYEFYITLLTEAGEGEDVPHLTPRLFTLQEGSRLHVGKKVTGNYTLKGVGPEEDVIFAATGTGEAPHNVMLWHLLRTGHRGRLVCIVCTRYEAEQAYRSLHLGLQERYPDYTYITLTTREPRNQGRKIYLQQFFKDGLLEDALGWKLDSDRTHVYLCGNPDMIGIPKVSGGKRVYPNPEGLVEILERRGFNSDAHVRARVNLHYEKYW